MCGGRIFFVRFLNEIAKFQEGIPWGGSFSSLAVESEVI